MNIAFIGHSHHRVTQSSRFFAEILAEMGRVESLWDETWRGEKPLKLTRLRDEADLVVVWQSVAYIKQLAALKHPNLVYVPMYDAAKDLRPSFWRRLPSVKILNFSSTLHQRVQACGCRSAAYFQYFPNPDQYRPVSPFDSLRGFFWQRQARPGWSDIKHLIGRDFASVHLHRASDPGGPVLAEPTLEEQRALGVSLTHWFPEKAEMLERLAASNVYFAPRLDEGIGLSFLEAMAMGMTVCAHRAPTHDEYIVDGVNGFLYSLTELTRPNWARAAEIGRRARGSVEKGYRRWIGDRDRLLDFLSRPAALGPARYARSGSPWPGGDGTAPSRGAQRTAASPGLIEGGKRLTRSPGRADPPRVTIATVVRNAADELAHTLASVLSQSFSDKEIVVIDGASRDRTREVLLAYTDVLDYWRSEPDAGPYDAMNKAADLAEGRWIIYIHAGDSFVDEDALARFVAGVPEHADFVIGHHVYLSSNGEEEVHRCSDFETTYRNLLSGRTDSTWLGGIPGHQATLTRVELIRQHRYDLQYRYAADHEFLYRMRARGARFHVEPVIVSQYVGGGLSTLNLFECLGEWRSIALRYSGEPKVVEREFRRLWLGTLRYSRRLGTFDWRSEPVRRHPLLTAAAEAGHRARWLLDRLDLCYSRLLRR